MVQNEHEGNEETSVHSASLGIFARGLGHDKPIMKAAETCLVRGKLPHAFARSGIPRITYMQHCGTPSLDSNADQDVQMREPPWKSIEVASPASVSRVLAKSM